MIIKGQARGRAKQLASHLLRADQNEAIQLVECRGTLAQDVEGALIEMEVRGKAARTERPLYHASISPEAATPLKGEQIAQAVDHLEERLGLHGQPRVVVVHRKKDREHIHVVWSRIEAESGNAISYSWNYRLHEQASRELEAMFGHRRLENSRSSRGRAGPRRTAKDHELRQGERSGMMPSGVSTDITALWFASSNGAEFRRKLEEAGYTLARGDRRVFVVIDRNGGVHSLARRIDGADTNAVRNKLCDITLGELPSVSTARERITSNARTVVTRKFASAAREVTRRGFRSPILDTVLQSRQNIRRVLSPSAARQSPGIVPRECSDFTSARQNVTYRSARAALIGEYATRIAEAIRYARRDELDAILLSLRAERAAAIAALGELHGGKKARPLGVNRRRRKMYRFRRSRQIR